MRTCAVAALLMAVRSFLFRHLNGYGFWQTPASHSPHQDLALPSSTRPRIVQATAICPTRLSPRAAPQSVRARMSRSFSVAVLTFLQAKSLPFQSPDEENPEPGAANSDASPERPGSPSRHTLRTPPCTALLSATLRVSLQHSARIRSRSSALARYPPQTISADETFIQARVLLVWNAHLV